MLKFGKGKERIYDRYGSYKMIFGFLSASLLCLFVNTVAFSFSKTLHSENGSKLNIDEVRLVDCFQRGLPYIHEGWIDVDMILELLKQFDQLDSEGKFVPSGLSNSAAEAGQGFNEKEDRLVCPIDLYDGVAMRQQSHEVMITLSQKIDNLRHELATILNRPSVNDYTLHHESYLSMSRQGSYLKRHMDERHEGLKRRKAWLLPSRRSVSWLLYLNDEGESWDKGGELRFFPPSELIDGTRIDLVGPGFAGSHDGNLQVGWLRRPSGLYCVYMDAWVRQSTESFIPRTALYIAVPSTSEHQSSSSSSSSLLPSSLSVLSPDGREYITLAFDTDSTPGDTIDMLRHNQNLFLNKDHDDATNFALIEDHELWQTGALPKGSGILDIIPKSGTLVLFDSVTVPHEVMTVREGGERKAVAGWFHENTQGFPDWAYSEG
jgi:Rps23 Pro-64 3,4-dihydroxylase Tpa1-like proline 4-hydroxylase